MHLGFPPCPVADALPQKTRKRKRKKKTWFIIGKFILEKQTRMSLRKRKIRHIYIYIYLGAFVVNGWFAMGLCIVHNFNILCSVLVLRANIFFSLGRWWFQHRPFCSFPYLHMYRNFNQYLVRVCACVCFLFTMHACMMIYTDNRLVISGL